MRDITLEALRLREKELSLDAVLIRGRIEEVRHMIAAVEHSRGGRPRKSVEIAIVPQRVAGAAHEPDCDERGPLPSLDDVRGILKGDDAA